MLGEHHRRRAHARRRTGGLEVADKTGSGSYGTTNSIGLLYPPNRAPIVAVGVHNAGGKRLRRTE